MIASQTNSIRVLLIDDHASVRWGLRKLVESGKLKCQVVGEAGNRNEALTLVRREQPNIILLDLDMGSENGIDLLPELLKESKANVIILTGVRDKATHERAVLRGARGVVLKEEPAETILKAIETVHRGELWLDQTTIGRVFSKLTVASEKGTADPEAEKIAFLTPRERQIISVITSEGHSTNKRIAASLNMSEHTLRNHLTSIYSKLDVENRLELFMYALTHGLDK